MARVLIIYGTTDGHTAKVARAIGDALRSAGVDVDVRDAARDAPSPDGYAGVIVAASVHAGGYQRRLKRWVRTHAETLRGKPNAFVSVCLGVLQHDPAVDRHLAEIITAFAVSTGWTPRRTTIVAGALLYTRYNWLKRWVMKRIASKAGGDTDTSRDYEYTDWAGLRDFAGEFRQAAELPAAPAETFPHSDATGGAAMKVREIMSEPVVTCTPETPLSTAARLMRDEDYGTLPVVDIQGKLAGIITDRDICLSFAASARNAAYVAVHEVMTRRVVTVLATDTLHTALHAMKKARIRRLPVLDTFGRLVGLLSIEDVVVRGLETGGISTDEIVMALRAMYERRPVAVPSELA